MNVRPVPEVVLRVVFAEISQARSLPDTEPTA